MIRAVKLIIVVLLFILIVIPPAQGRANSINEINKQLEELRKKQELAEQKAAEAQDRIDSINQQQKRVKQDLNQIIDKISDASEELMTLRTSINKNEKKLDETEKQLIEAMERVAKRDKLLGARLRLMYMNGTVSYLEVLINATSFTDFLDRFNALKLLVDQDKRILESNKEDQRLIAKQKNEIKNLMAKLTRQYEEVAEVRETLLAQEKKKEVKIASLNQKEKNLEQITEEQEEFLIGAASKESRLLSLRRKKEAEKEAGMNNEQDNYHEGEYVYPLPETYPLTSNYGYRIDPITGARGAFHDGWDIGAPGGVDVLAASDGTVIVAEWYGGYGNAVIIDHGGGIWTLYAHMRSLNVSKGDTVKAGGKVGAVGTTGRSTGNHLHFEVRKDRKSVDPNQYLSL